MWANASEIGGGRMPIPNMQENTDTMCNVINYFTYSVIKIISIQ